MATPKRKGTAGIAIANAYNHQPTSPAHVLVCDSCNLTGEPKTIEQTNNMTPDNAAIESVGKDCSFEFSGIEPNITQAGYIMAAAFGGDEIVSDAHVIEPGEDSLFIVPFKDLRNQVGATASQTTEVGLGGKIASLSFEVASKSFAKMSASGGVCDYGEPAATLAKALPAFPLSSKSLRAGDYKIGLNGAAPASDRGIRGVKMDYAREQNLEDNTTLDSDQPNDITEGGRTFDFEITRQFAGAQALAEYNAWMNDQDVSLDIEFITDPDGTPQSLRIEVPHARITGPYAGEIGTGEDPIMATLKCRAFVSGSDPIIRVTVDDNTIVAWAA